jgi:flagellar motor switch protein FliG
MSMLARYRKQGGFQQLLQLIETCNATKRDQLLKIIDQEDPGWGSLLRAKTLSMQKIFSWDPLVVAELMTEFPVRILAVALKALPPEALTKATHAMNHQQKRDLEGMMAEINPNAGEIEAANMKFITKVRELERDGRLKLDKVDPSVAVKDFKAA